MMMMMMKVKMKKKKKIKRARVQRELLVPCVTLLIFLHLVFVRFYFSFYALHLCLLTSCFFFLYIVLLQPLSLWLDATHHSELVSCWLQLTKMAPAELTPPASKPQAI